MVSYSQSFAKDIAYLCHWPKTLDLTRTTKSVPKLSATGAHPASFSLDTRSSVPLCEAAGA